jgi:tripartite-type tricarboxylate transporter receptor subunit TctC
VLNALLYKNPGYSAERDFTPLSQAVDVPLVMLVNEQVPARSVAEFVRYAKANPKTLNFGSTGTGGAFHLTGELFKHAAGIEMTHVPYKGGNAAVQAMLSGDVQVLFGVVGSSLQLIQAGKLRPLAVCTPSRVPVLAETPTISESGYPGFEATVRYGIVVAAQTPKPILADLVDATVKAIDNAEFRSTWMRQGYIVPERLGPVAYAAALASDREVWGRLIRSRGITLDQ